MSETGKIKKIPVFSGTSIKTQTVEDIIDDAKGIIRDQVSRLKIISRQGHSLNNDEVKNLRQFVQSLIELSREEREIDKTDNLKELLSGMSNEELLDLYKKQIEVK